MTETAAFTLRFRDPATHRLLRDVARAKGVSMSELAEQLVAQGLRGEAAELERTLESVLAHLRSYRTDPVAVEEPLRELAQAEVEEPEPLPSRRVASADMAASSERASRGRARTGGAKPAAASAKAAGAGKAAAGGTKARRSTKSAARPVSGSGTDDGGPVGSMTEMARRLSVASSAELPRRRPGRSAPRA
jgi:hypothetical protein